MSRGFITLHRTIQAHWIFENESYLKAWLTILMEVNHKENKTLIKGKLLSCPRGQSLMSHQSWADKFGKNWNRAKVIRFFKLLQSDHMIVQENEHVTTRLTVCNYSKYQDFAKKSEQVGEQGTVQVTVQQADTKRTGDSTQPNNVNNDNNGNKVLATPPNNDHRDKFQMFVGWVPTVAEQVQVALTQAGITQSDFDQQLPKYIASKIDSPDKRTQHQWNQSFKTTLMKFANSQTGKPQQKSNIQRGIEHAQRQ